jgi:hypothetical protein
VYQQHYDSVRAAAAELKMPLLEYRIQEGWGPLCQFLGREMPCKPFPTGNTKSETHARIQSLINMEIRRLLTVLWILLIIVSLFCILIYSIMKYAL